MNYTRLKLYVDDVEYTYYKDVIKIIDCDFATLKKLIQKAEDNSDDSFTYNDKVVSFCKKIIKVYVKYSLNDKLIVYLLYFIRQNGNVELLRTISEEEFSKISINEDEYKFYDTTLPGNTTKIEHSLFISNHNREVESI